MTDERMPGLASYVITRGRDDKPLVVFMGTVVRFPIEIDNNINAPMLVA